MGKSELRKVLREYCEQCFTDAPEESFNVIVEDSIVALRKFYSKDARELVTMEQMVKRVFGPSVIALKHVPVYVHLFDKASFLTETKAPEQDARDKASSRPVSTHTQEEFDVPDKLDAAQRDQWGHIANTARDWTAAITDRSNRQQIITQMCRQAAYMLPRMMKEAGVPSTHIMIIDYEEKGRKPVALELRSDTVFVPDMWNVHQGRFVNKLGEYDVSAFWYARHKGLQELIAKPNLLIRSIDTDLLLVSMLDAEDPVFPVHVEMARTKDTPVCYFDPTRANAWIKDTAAESADPVADFVKTYVLSGTDFVRGGIPSVGNYTYIRTWLKTGGKKTPLQNMKQILMKKIEAVMDSYKPGGLQMVKLEEVQPVPRGLRADYALLYWRWSVRAPELVPDPEGWGYSRKNGRLVETEALTQGTVAPPPKRIKVI